MSDKITKIPDQKEIIAIDNLETIRQLMAVGEVINRYQLSIPETIELTRKRGYLIIRAGELYGGLEEEAGRPENNSLPRVTNKQQAVEEIGKTRKTIAKWMKMSKKPSPYQTVNDYCNHQLNIIEEATIEGLYHYFNGILVSKHTGNIENYTPKYIIDAARIVMGSINLDPASCEYAQQIIRADEYFTEDDNGLEQEWYGNVFLNPPYKMPLIEQFVDKLISELPHLKAAILLTNNNTDTQWFLKATKAAQLICFTTGRIGFYTEEIDKTAPTNGQTFFYYGDNEIKFKEIFDGIGWIARHNL